jgi:hypothetical protein
VKTAILAQLMMGGATVAVRVDPNDHSRIALSLGEEPPTVTMASSGDPNTASAARILGQGVPCKAVIVQTQPLGMRNPKGDDMYAFTDGQGQQALHQAQKQLTTAGGQAGTVSGQAGKVSSQAQQELGKAAKLTTCLSSAGTDVGKIQLCQAKFGH